MWKNDSQKVNNSFKMSDLKNGVWRERPASYPLDDGAISLSYLYDLDKSIALRNGPCFHFENEGFFAWKKRGKTINSLGGRKHGNTANGATL